MRAALSALTAEEKEDECISHVIQFRRAWAEGEWRGVMRQEFNLKNCVSRKLCSVLPAVHDSAQDVWLPDRLVPRQGEEKRSHGHHQSVSI